MLKKLICAISAAVLAIPLASCGISDETAAVPEVTGEFKTTVLQSGKADAIVLETEKHTVVIDTGEKNDGDEVVEYLEKNGIESIDYLFITHFDRDHVGGAPEVIENVEIGEIVTPDYEGNNKEYEKFIEALEETDMTAARLNGNMTFTLDDVLFEVYPPEKSYYAEEDNDYSLVINVTHGENTFMFAGDCETERLSELPGQMDMEHILVKIPHHGRYCEGMEEFIESIDPKYAIITDSDKNPADDEVISELEAVGCEVYRTVDGAVTAVSDGKSISITQWESK